MPDHPVRAYPQHYVPGDLSFAFSVRFEAADGTITELPRQAPVAGTRGTWILTVRNDHGPVPAGTVFTVTRFDCQYAFEFQTDRPERRDHAVLEARTDARLALGIGRESVHLCHVAVEAGTFARGDSFEIRLGDTRGGGAGSEVFWTATVGQLLVGVDLDGSGTFRGIAAGPLDVRVVAHPEPRRLRLLGPSFAAVDEPFALHVGLFDRNGNPCESFGGAVTFDVGAGVTGLPPSLEFAPADGGVRIVEGVRFTTAGVHRLRARAGDLTGVANPTVVEAAPERRLFWGDVHAHGWGDSTMHLMHLRSERLDPSARHAQGRRLGRFDFACPASMSMDPEKREETFGPYRDACREHDEPGRYVPFLAYEHHPQAGDRQVIFRDYEDEPAPPPMREPIETLLAHYGDRDDVLLQVHIGGDPPHWDLHRPARERFLEVCSGFGAAEWLLQEALEEGYRPGLCGASDLHVGWMGGPRSVETFRGRFGQKYPLNQRDSAYGTGPITAIRAPRLTRADLWDAIEARHTYGTSGARMVLDLQLTAGTARAEAGDEMRLGTEGEVVLRLRVHACAPLVGVEVIAGDRLLRSLDAGGALDLDETLTLPAAELPGSCVYLRVEQADGEWGWTSPVYLERDGETPAGTDLPAWNAEDMDPAGLGDVEAGGAQAHLETVRAYLAREEHLERFAEITPAGVRDLDVGRCALFRCLWGEEQLPMTIRWFFDFEVPKIRFDFGWRDYGAVIENRLGPQLLARYG